MKIIRARLKPMPGTTYLFVSLKGQITALLSKTKNDDFDFVMEENGRRSIKSFGPNNLTKELIDQEVQILDSRSYAKFNKDGSIDVINIRNEGALPRESTLKQMRRIRKASRRTDIGDRISDMGKEGSNIGWISNPLDKGIESYEDSERRNKKFQPSWNLRNIKPFKN